MADKTRLEFDGGHPSKFYQMIKKNPLNWKHMDLENTNLGRIDLYYDRKLKESDRVEDFEAFLSHAANTISSGSRSLVVDLKPQALRICHRKTSLNFFIKTNSITFGKTRGRKFSQYIFFSSWFI